MNIKILVVIAAVILLAFSSIAMAADRTAMVGEVNGEVLMRQAGGEWKAAEMGANLGVSDEIKTSNGASAQLVLDDGKISLRENTNMKISTMDLDPASGEKFTYLDLAIGKILVEAEKLQGNSKFEVRTPTSTTGVRGTVFEVSVESA